MSDEQALCGWLPPESRTVEQQETHERILSAMFPFAIMGTDGASADDSAGKRMVLSDFVKQVNGGKQRPAKKQLVGDCVSFGWAHAIEYLQAFEILRLNDPEQWKTVFPPYIYGISRVQIGGGRINGDGSLGSWAAEGVKRFGVLADGLPGVPEYSASVARRWGASGPPAEMIALARPHLVKSTASVKTYAAVRQSIVNGYPVPVASNVGFERFHQDRGKLWGRRGPTWNHQMCLIGVDDTPGRPGCLCLNSWGPDAHGPPVDDTPPGSFWIDADTIDDMAGQGDTFAVSQFDGFPRQKLDLGAMFPWIKS